jgi:hypothetical protein
MAGPAATEHAFQKNAARQSAGIRVAGQEIEPRAWECTSSDLACFLMMQLFQLLSDDRSTSDILAPILIIKTALRTPPFFANISKPFPGEPRTTRSERSATMPPGPLTRPTVGALSLAAVRRRSSTRWLQFNAIALGTLVALTAAPASALPVHPQQPGEKCHGSSELESECIDGVGSIPTATGLGNDDEADRNQVAKVAPSPANRPNEKGSDAPATPRI